MSTFRQLLFWLALAVLGALAWQLLAVDPGHVFVRFRGIDYSTNVPVALGLVLLAMAALWLLSKLLLMPFRAWRAHRRHRAQVRLADGLLALHEGRWERAVKLLERSAGSDRTLRLPALVAAAQAADARGDHGESERLLAATDDDEGKSPAVATLARVEHLLRQGRAHEALARIDTIAGALPPRGLTLRVEALIAANRAAEAWGQLNGLRSTRALAPDTLAALETRLATAALREADDAQILADRWDGLPQALRQMPDCVAAYAHRAVALGLEDTAADAIEHALASGWSETLALLYGQIPPGRQGSRLAKAEAWLKSHPASPGLLVTLGRLCRDERLWGKAEDYLHRAIAQGAGAEGWEELGHCFAAQGDEHRARLSYANALRAARAEATVELPGRGLRERIQDLAVPEERDEHGMPRLPLA